MRPELFKKWTRPFRLRRRLRNYLPDRSQRLDILCRPGPTDLVKLRREGRRLTMVLADREAMTNDRVYYIYRLVVPVILHLFSRTSTSVREARAELSDGTTVRSDHIVFCSVHPDSLLIPDPDFFNTNGYDDFRRMIPRQHPWSERDDTIVWRGSTTGRQEFLGADLDSAAPGLKPRIRMCGLLKSLPSVDVRISRVVQSQDAARDEERLRRAGLFGDAVLEQTWLDRKFAIDIDGNVNTWRNFFVRLLFGCCVIKIESSAGYRQWYYDRLKPWSHYVPVRADMSDLLERIQWCREHPSECEQIAANAQSSALPMTFEREAADAIARINRRLGNAQ